MTSTASSPTNTNRTNLSPLPFSDGARLQDMVTAEAERLQLKRKEQASREIIAEISRKLKVTIPII